MLFNYRLACDAHCEEGDAAPQTAPQTVQPTEEATLPAEPHLPAFIRVSDTDDVLLKLNRIDQQR
jgi:hypothetical protein